MPGEVKAGTTALRQSAIRQVALKRRNPFFARQRIAIQNKDFGRSLDERIVASKVFQVTSQLAESCVAAIVKVTAVGLGLLTGLALAIPLIVIPLVTAGFLVYADFPSGLGAFLFNQSWRHYTGWALSGVTAFFCPYLLVGIPLNWALHFFRPIHSLFDARKMSRELERDSGNNDPGTLLSVRVTSYYHDIDKSPFSRPVENILFVIAGITVAFSGVGTMACFVMLYLKLGAMLIHQGGCFVGIIGMFVGLRFPYQFLHSRMGALSVEHLIRSLLHGEPYCTALRRALVASMG